MPSLASKLTKIARLQQGKVVLATVRFLRDSIGSLRRQLDGRLSFLGIQEDLLAVA
jgi:hypothetical protein